MMDRTIDIFNAHGCLSQATIEASISGELSISDNSIIQEHIKECQLCKNALAGAKLISNVDDYSLAINDLRTRWSEKKIKSEKAKKVKFALVYSAAATLVILFSVIALIRYQKQVRSNIISQLGDEGIGIEKAMGDLPVQVLAKSKFYDVRPDNEDSARNEYLKTVKTQESVLPVASIMETTIYPDISRHDFKEVITEEPEVEQTNSRQLLSPFRVMSQPPAQRHYRMKEEVSDDNEIFVVVEDMPRFRNGDLINFRQYVQENIRYPKQALNRNISGRVYIQFVINKHGELVDAVIIKSDHPLLNEEVLRAISDSPEWTPGKQRGRPVDISLIMPVDFVLTR